jgi:hypothetical protein
MMNVIMLMMVKFVPMRSPQQENMIQMRMILTKNHNDTKKCDDGFWWRVEGWGVKGPSNPYSKEINSLEV